MYLNFVSKGSFLSRFAFKEAPGIKHCLFRLFCSTRNWGMPGKYQVLVTRTLPDQAMQILRNEERLDIDFWHKETVMPNNELLERVKGKDGLYCLLTDKIDEELLNIAGDQLKIVSTMSVGYDHIDITALKKRGILLGHTPDVLTDATADLTVALLLATSRRLIEGTNTVRSGEWGSWDPLWMCGSGLKYSTVGIVGMGRVGQAVCRRLAPFEPARFLYCGHRERKQDENPVKAAFVDIEELVSSSDFVICSCALTRETAEMFNKSLFSKMKQSAVFINVSRGGVVNQDDLYDALLNGTIKAAGLDVTTPEPLPSDHKLLNLKNCVILPHIGSADVATRTAMAVLAAKNLITGLLGENMPAQVKL